MTPAISAAALPQSVDGRDIPAWLAEFYRAYVTRDAHLLAAILDDDVEWLLTGPVDQFDYYGRRHGKAEAIEVITRIMPCFFRISDFEIQHLVLQGERVATYLQVRACQRETGRSICFRGAHFLRFRAGKLVSFRSIADTFDVAEQVVGHPIDVNTRIEPVPLVPGEDELLTL
jgi:ketosteroid isomerase-like protein